MTTAVVVGDGIVGRCCSLELKRRGLEVVRFSAPDAGVASTAAAGLLAPQLEAERPGPLLELLLRAAGAYPAFLDGLSRATGRPSPQSFGHAATGRLAVALDDDELARLEAQVAWHRAVGLRAELLTAQELALREPAVTSTATGGAFFPDDHHLDPRPLLAALGEACAGLPVHVDAVSRLLTRDGRVAGVRTASGAEVAAQVVVLAAGAWASRIEGAGLPPGSLFPVRGQLLQLAAGPGGALHTTLTSGPLYAVPRPSGQVVVGSTLEPEAGYVNAVTAEALDGLEAQARALLPGLSRVRVDAWAGLRPATRGGVPYLGESGLPGLLWAVGHFRNGILLGPLSGLVVGRLAAGEEPGLDLRAFDYRRPPARLE